MQRGSAGINRDCVGTLDVTRKLGFELFGFRTGRQPAGPQAIHYLRDLRLTDAWFIERN